LFYSDTLSQVTLYFSVVTVAQFKAVSEGLSDF